MFWGGVGSYLDGNRLRVFCCRLAISGGFLSRAEERKRLRLEQGGVDLYQGGQ